MKRVYLEITNACNLRCPFCEAYKSNDFLSLDEIKRRLDNIKEVCDYVYLHVLGEPLLHPNFDEILDYLDKLELKLQLVTNGTLLYKYPNILKHKCLRKLSISIHSIDNIDIPDNYFESIKKLINEDTLVNIELRFYDLNNLKANSLKILNELKNNFTLEITSKKDSYKINDHTYIYTMSLFHWPNINDETIECHGYCKGINTQIAILVSGKVVLCCLDAAGHTCVGNINEMSLKNILNSEYYLNIKNEYNKGHLYFKLCQKCTYRLRFKK